jgi:formate dehydrogenase subunit gamma
MHPSASNRADESTSIPKDSTSVIDAAIARLGSLKGALLPILHDIHEQLGYVPPAAVARIAQGLNLSQAEVHGVISFYHDFRTSPPGRHVIKLCRAEACQAMGSKHLEAHLTAQLGIGMNDTTADGSVTVEPVYCLGNCALAPSLLIDGKVIGRVTKRRLDQLLDGCRNQGAGA